jgi:hypothetical protein
MGNGITRRQFVKRAAGVGALAIGGTAALGGGKALIGKLSHVRRMKERQAARPADGQHWFAPDERPSVRALADLVIPPDQSSPGAGEPEVIERLDRLVATSASRQELYARGFVGFDELATREGVRSFGELRSELQRQIITAIDSVYIDTTTGGYSLVEIAQRNLVEAYHTWPSPGGWSGFSEAIQLWPQLVVDVKEAFYTSNVAWQWLAYDGPPFPRGYFGRVGQCFTNKGREGV